MKAKKRDKSESEGEKEGDTESKEGKEPNPEEQQNQNAEEKSDEESDMGDDDATTEAGQSRKSGTKNSNANEVETTTIMDVQINLDPCGEYDDITKQVKKVGKTAKAFLKSVQGIEPTFKLKPIDPNDLVQSDLHNIDKLDWKSLGQVKRYFGNIRPMKKGGRLFLKIRASFKTTVQILKGNLDWYFRERNERIEESKIQSHKTAIPAWFLYSLRSMDVQVLSNTLKELFKCEINCRFMRISDGTWSRGRDTSEDPRALHIECAETNAQYVLEQLHKFYGSTVQTFPLGIKM